MSASSMRRLAVTEENRDEDTNDVAAFEYDVEGYGVPNLTSEFFPADDSRIWPTGTARMPFIVFGYPSERSFLTPHLHRVKTEQALDADGLSGGPRSYIGGAPASFLVGTAGIIMRG